MTSKHVIRCRETGEALANKLDGGTCVCKAGQCEMGKMRAGSGDYARKREEDDSFDGMGFAIGIATGFPVGLRGITGGSILGALLHPTDHAKYDVTPAFTGGGGDVGGGGASASWAPDPAPTPTPSTSAPEPSYSAPEPSYSAPAPEPAAPSYSAPEPSYSAPDTSSSFSSDSGGGGGGGGGGE